MPNITNIPTNFHSIKSKIRQQSRTFWQRQWTDDLNRTLLHAIKPELGIWSSSSRGSRLEEKMLAKLRIGHTYLTHSHIFSQSERPICNTCHLTLTVKHILLLDTQASQAMKLRTGKPRRHFHCQTLQTFLQTSTPLNLKYVNNLEHSGRDNGRMT